MRLLLPALLLLLGPACGWWWSSPEPPVAEVALTPPWSELSLPVAGAMVTYSDADTITVRHPDGEPATLGAAYRLALEAGGWTLALDTSAGGIVNQTFDKDGGSLALSAMEDGGKVVVSVSRLPF